MAFVHLHTHTEYSLLDGSNKIKEYVRRVKELGMTAAAITDHGAMYGVIDFYEAALAEGIKPILGCEVYVAPGSRFDRETSHADDRYYHLILLAENNEGYQNLMKIVSRGFVDGFYYKPRVDRELLETYHEGIICLSACLAGEVQRLLGRGFYEEAKEAALWHARIFGPEHYYLELQDHGIPLQRTVNQGLLRMSEETGIPLVATNDCHYTYAGDWEAHDVLLCIQTNAKVADEDRMRYEGGQFYVKSEEEMRQLFPYAPQALENTAKIAERCNVTIAFGETKLPRFDVPDGFTAEEYLTRLCREGLSRRYGERAAELLPQLEYELGVIRRMGYVDYFLIVWDFINYARTHDIPVGPGRGSAAGSLVAYTTGITDIDPVRYSLLFERFLNPERVSMPDIDVDFDFERRGEVIDYVVEKYGKDCVTQIVTFGTMAARNVIRDVGRALDLPYGFVDQVAKQIPQELGITIDKALVMNSQLRSMYETDEKITHLIDMARKLEGLPRHTSMHAAGVVISQKPMEEYVPLARAADGTITTQFTMTTIEHLGLLKMDFLGLRTLTVIDDAVKMARQTHPGADIDISKISYDEKPVYDLIASGHCEGIFQLESPGMKSFMKELRPESLEDVIAGISLYRPGPMDFIPAYLRGKTDRNAIVYDCPQLEPILSATYGCIVYQEQVMQIVQNLAGFTLGRADMLRRAMSKKKADVMNKERQAFVYGDADSGVPGCIANGISEAVANKIYDEMVDFAKYAFNKSHAAAYAVVAYQTAWLKYHYPQEFMASLMTSVIDVTSKIANYIQVCRQMGITVLPPDVNAGDGRFAVADGQIRYGMYAIKSIGRSVVDAIVSERAAGGPFRSLEDFLSRVSGKDVSKRAVENLIKAGAMDGLDGNRRQKVYTYAKIMDQLASSKKNTVAGQMTLFDIASEDQKEEFSVTLPDVSEFDRETMLMFEKEVLGIYVSGHPLETCTAVLDANVTATSEEFVMDDETGTAPIEDGRHVVIGGMLSDITIKYTRKNETMAFVTIEDLVGSVEVIVFPKVYEASRQLLTEDAKLFVSGRASVEEDKDAKLICEEIRPFSDASREIWVRLADRAAYDAVQDALAAAAKESLQTSDLVVYLAAERAIRRMPPEYRMDDTEATLAALRELAGEKNVSTKEKPLEFKGNGRRF